MTNDLSEKKKKQIDDKLNVVDYVQIHWISENNEENHAYVQKKKKNMTEPKTTK